MPLVDTSTGFGAATKLLHWLTVLLVAALFGIGLYMVELEISPEKFEVYALHKSIGLTVLVLTALRVGWRALNPTPVVLGAPPPWQRAAARATHRALYALLLCLPLSGWVLSSAADIPFFWFGLFEVPDLTPPSDAVREAAQTVHRLLGYALATLIAVHVGGALKHHFADRDATLLRMLPGRFHP